MADDVFIPSGNETPDDESLGREASERGDDAPYGGNPSGDGHGSFIASDGTPSAQDAGFIAGDGSPAEEDGAFIAGGDSPGEPEPRGSRAVSDDAHIAGRDGPEPEEVVPPAPPDRRTDRNGGGASENVVPDGRDETVQDRIRRVTREGGFGAGPLPMWFTRSDENLRTIRSENPFERLFLDGDQWEKITDQMVTRHAALLRVFWSDKVRTVTGGAGDPATRKATLDRFADGNQATLLSFERVVNDTADRLSTASKRKDAAEEVREKVVAPVRAAVLARLQDFVLADHTLSPAESEALLNQAVSSGWSREACARFVLNKLEELGFHTASGARPSEEAGPPAEVLLSSSWTDREGPDDPGSNPDEKKPAPQTIAAALERETRISMIGGVLTPDHIRQLYDTAEEAGFSRDDAAEFIADGIKPMEAWRPAPGESSVDGSLADALASIRWLSPEEYEKERARIDSERRRAFEKRLATALASGTLSAGSAKTLIGDAPLAPEEAAAALESELKARGFRPARGRARVGGSAAERVTSVDWTTTESTPSPVWKVLAGLAAVALVAIGAVVAAGIGEEEDLQVPVAVVSTAGLNVRTEPTTAGGEGTVLGEVSRDDELRVTGYTVNEEGATWLRVSHGGRDGWISADPDLVQFGAYDLIDELNVEGDVVVPAVTEVTEYEAETSRDGEDGYRQPGGGERVITGPEPGGEGDEGDSDDPGPAEPSVRPPPDVVYSPSEVDAEARARTRPVVDSGPGGHNGTVLVDVTVSKQGRVTDASCRSSVSRTICADAERRASGVPFEAARLRGYDVRSTGRVAVRFRASAETRQPPPPPQPEAYTSSPGASGAAQSGSAQTSLTVQRVRLESAGSGARVTLDATQTASGFDRWTQLNRLSVPISLTVDGRRAGDLQLSGWPGGALSGSGSRSGSLAFTLPGPPAQYRGAPAVLQFPLDDGAGTTITVRFTLP